MGNLSQAASIQYAFTRNAKLPYARKAIEDNNFLPFEEKSY